MILWLLFASLSEGLFYPTQIHLSWTETPGEMRVTWFSRIKSSGLVKYRPFLCMDTYMKTMKISSKVRRIDFGNQFSRFGYIHTAVLSNLTSECTYSYSVFNGLLESDTFMFKAKTHGQDLSRYSLIIYGDMGTYWIGQMTFDLIMSSLQTKEIMAVVHLGDMGYDLPDHQGNIGDKFMNMIQPLAAYYPYMTVPGNHEGKKNFTHYSDRFIMPENPVSKNSSLFYSLDIGPVHYIFLHTTILLKKKAEVVRENMKKWLKDDLEKAKKNRDEVPWIVTFHHHPLYCSHQVGDKSFREDCEIQTSIIRHNLEDLFYNYSVDLVLAGHVHHYERQTAIYKNKTVASGIDTTYHHHNAKAPIHIISGNAGNRLQRNDPVSRTPDDWSVFMSPDYGFGRLTVMNKTCLLWKQYSSESNKLIDHLYITKDLNH
jgi:hypothetical protein